MIVGMSAFLPSRRAASPDLARRAFGGWPFAAIADHVALARAATLPPGASLRFCPHPPLEPDGRCLGVYQVGYAAGGNA